MDGMPLAPTDWSQVKDAMTDTDMDARFALDSRLHKQFYIRPVLQQTLSDQAQRPIYADVVHIRIIVPGDKLSIIDRIASEDDMRRFAEEYAKFQSGQGQQVVGTLLDVVPWMSRSKVEEYRYFGIHTVEQLSDASDSVGQKFPGFHQDRDRAKKFIEAATGTNARVAELEKQLAEIRSRVEGQEAAKAVIAAPILPTKATAKV
jgi:hypothetical protein